MSRLESPRGQFYNRYLALLADQAGRQHDFYQNRQHDFYQNQPGARLGYWPDADPYSRHLPAADACDYSYDALPVGLGLACHSPGDLAAFQHMADRLNAHRLADRPIPQALTEAVTRNVALVAAEQELATVCPVLELPDDPDPTEPWYRPLWLAFLRWVLLCLPS